MNQPINGMQAMLNGMSAQWQRERAATQMTLGKFIAALEAMLPEAEIDALSDPHSYRGYYCDLAFESNGGEMRVADVLSMCRSAMGQVFEGYKGGDYMIGSLTPVWIAHYGSCGKKIMAINPDGTIETAEDD